MGVARLAPSGMPGQVLLKERFLGGCTSVSWGLQVAEPVEAEDLVWGALSTEMQHTGGWICRHC